MRKELTNEYLSSLCMELCLLLQSGIPAGEGVAMLLEEERDREAAAALRTVSDAMEAGQPLYEGLEAAAGFPRYLVELVEIGEKTGNLDRVLRTLSRHYDRQAETAHSLRNAVLYPAVLLCMMLVVVVVLITKVLPIFEDVYRQLGATMTGAAAAVLRLGAAMADHWAVIAAVLAVLILACIAGRGILRRALVPGRLKRLIAEERFASSMAMTVASGFDVDDAMEMSAKLCGDGPLTGRIAACRERLAAGAELQDAVADSGVLQGLSARLLAMGVRTGSADAVLSDIAERTQRRIVDETESLISRIEPTLVIFMSVLVGVILLAVMLPLLGILSTLG